MGLGRNLLLSSLQRTLVSSQSVSGFCAAATCCNTAQVCQFQLCGPKIHERRICL